MKKIGLIVSLLLTFLFVSEAMPETVKWGDIHFDPLINTIDGFSVETVVGYLFDDTESMYRQNLEEGKTWSCIFQVLTEFVEVQSTLKAKGSPGDPLQYELLLNHSGQNWSFWHRVAMLAKTNEDLGLPKETFCPELQGLMVEMKDAFKPYLNPQSQD